MKVWRIERSNGKGICLSGNLCREYHKAGSEQAHKPCPCNHLPMSALQIVLLEAQGWKYAFQSISAMTNWFPAEDGRERMKAEGGKLVEYTVDASYVLPDTVGMQIMFDPSLASRNAEYDLVTLEETK